MQMFALPFAAVRGLCEQKYRWGARRISCKTSRRISTQFAMMYGRVALSVRENQLTQDLELLMQVMDSRLQSLATLYSDFRYQGSTEESSTTQNSRLFLLERSGNAGRPRYEIGKSKSMD